MFDEHVIHGDYLYPAPADNGASFKIRLPWYRSLPLSCIERLEVTIDGEKINQESISVSIYGQTHSMREVPALHEIQWFVLDELNVNVQTTTPLAVGKHNVSIDFKLRIPYNDPEFIKFEFTQVIAVDKNLEYVGREW